jgi:hypothetical protein
MLGEMKPVGTTEAKGVDMQERRRDDEKITQILTTLARMSVKVDQVHTSWFGKDDNGGYKKKMDTMEGERSTLKVMVGSGGGIGLIALAITLYKLFSGG